MQIYSILLVAAGLSLQVNAADFSVTANSLENLNGSLSSIRPEVLTPPNAADYLDKY